MIQRKGLPAPDANASADERATVRPAMRATVPPSERATVPPPERRAKPARSRAKRRAPAEVEVVTADLRRDPRSE